MKLHLTVEDGKPWAVYVNGELMAEGIGGSYEGIRNLERALHEARASTTMVKAMAAFIRSDWSKHKDHVNKDSKRLHAAAEGLIDGINNVTCRFECYAESVPSAPGRHGKGSPSYRSGYDLGKWMFRCLEVLDRAKADRAADK